MVTGHRVKMRERSCWRWWCACLLLLLSLAGTVSRVAAEKVDLTPAQLRKIATHIVRAKVLSIRRRTEDTANYRYTRYVATVEISTVEKGGSGLQKGGRCDVRYWRRVWTGPTTKVNIGGKVVALKPTDTAGHRGLPAAGDTVRIYLAQNAYDGFTRENKDGGFNVIGANGFEMLSSGGMTERSRNQ